MGRVNRLGPVFLQDASEKPRQRHRISIPERQNDPGMVRVRGTDIVRRGPRQAARVAAIRHPARSDGHSARPSFGVDARIQPRWVVTNALYKGLWNLSWFAVTVIGGFGALGLAIWALNAIQTATLRDFAFLIVVLLAVAVWQLHKVLRVVVGGTRGSE